MCSSDLIFTFRLDVEVEKYDLKIKDVSLYPSAVCPGDDLRIDMRIENTGLKDLDKAMIYVNIDDLDITKKMTGIEIDEGNRETKTMTIIVPDDTKPGVYFIKAEAFWKEETSEKTDTFEDVFTVKNCTPAPPQEKKDGENKEKQVFEVIIPPVPTGQVFAVPVKKKPVFFESNAYIALLIITNILILALIILIITQAKRKES